MHRLAAEQNRGSQRWLTSVLGLPMIILLLFSPLLAVLFAIVAIIFVLVFVKNKGWAVVSVFLIVLFIPGWMATEYYSGQIALSEVCEPNKLVQVNEPVDLSQGVLHEDPQCKWCGEFIRLSDKAFEEFVITPKMSRSHRPWSGARGFGFYRVRLAAPSAQCKRSEKVLAEIDGAEKYRCVVVESADRSNARFLMRETTATASSTPFGTLKRNLREFRDRKFGGIWVAREASYTYRFDGFYGTWWANTPLPNADYALRTCADRVVSRHLTCKAGYRC